MVDAHLPGFPSESAKVVQIHTLSSPAHCLFSCVLCHMALRDLNHVYGVFGGGGKRLRVEYGVVRGVAAAGSNELPSADSSARSRHNSIPLRT